MKRLEFLLCSRPFRQHSPVGAEQPLNPQSSGFNGAWSVQGNLIASTSDVASMRPCLGKSLIAGKSKSPRIAWTFAAVSGPNDGWRTERETAQERIPVSRSNYAM